MCLTYTKNPNETFEFSKAFIHFYFSQFYKKKKQYGVSWWGTCGARLPALKDRVLNDDKIL